jgi:hypothetical protein
MEHYGSEINDKSLRLPGGKQQIVMDGYQIPLMFRNGLAYLQCCPPTDAEVDLLPHLIMMADVDWDPTLYDNVISDLHKLYDQDIDDVPHGNFDAHGNYLHRTLPHILFSQNLNSSMYTSSLRLITSLMIMWTPSTHHSLKTSTR